jgi:bifunctional aspartokinase / homoserine dehydrogenase 1
MAAARSAAPSARPRRAARVEVHKFGGASLADAAAIRHAAQVLGTQPRPAVAVVSAMGGVTDALLSIATAAATGDLPTASEAATALRDRHIATAQGVTRAGPRRQALRTVITQSFAELQRLIEGLAALRELTPRTRDFIVARGERLSAQLLVAALEEAGEAVEFIDATAVIHTDGVHDGASPDLAATDLAARRVLRPLLRRGVLPVVPGFIGCGHDAAVVTLGRGGSDLTATLLARALGAATVSLWKDVPGFLTADPRVVADARVIPQLHPRVAVELAYYGAKVLHPRALIPVAHRRITVRVRPIADPSAPGTEIVAGPASRRHPVQAISAFGAQALLTVEGSGMLGVPGIAARTFGALHHAGVSVSLISQSSSEHSICFTVPDAAAERARAAVLEAFAVERQRRDIDGVSVRRAVATLAVVGQGMRGTPGIASRTFAALADGGLNVIAVAQGASELNISVVLDAADVAAATRRIHAAFQLHRIGGGLVAPSARVDVVLLGFGQIGRSLAAMLSRARVAGVSLRVVGVIDRSGSVFSARGIAARELRAMAARKAEGTPLVAAHVGTADAREALRHIARHALSRPILVDVTADDTAALLIEAVEGGMDVVLANKRPLAGPLATFRALHERAHAAGRRVRHETTVGAGLPVIDTFRKLVDSGDRVLRIDGCTSGTLGYLLTEVSKGRAFSVALRRAMQLGYTEPDPRDDLGGVDVARKALILARLLGFAGELEDIAVESLVPPALRSVSRDAFVEQIGSLDAAWAARVEEATAQGGVLRYVASVTARQVSVGLQVVPRSSPLAALDGTDNQLVFTTRRYRSNPLVITGPGAGPAVTAAGVLNDVIALATST